MAAAPRAISGGASVSGSYNLIGTGGTGRADRRRQPQPCRRRRPLLAPLGDYGGPTQTMALLPGSPAIGRAARPCRRSRSGRPDRRPARLPPQRGRHRRLPDQGFRLTPVAGSTPQTAVAGTAFANPWPSPSRPTTQPVPIRSTAASSASPPIPPPTAPGHSLGPHGGVIAAVTVNGQTSEQASVTAAANAVAGSYTVTASAARHTRPASA